MDTAQTISELENLVMNIQGGVQICKLDDNFTILYMNRGFCNLVGYTYYEIKTLFNNEHIRLLRENDIQNIRQSIVTQLKNASSFTVEYQMRKKDGSTIWVFAKGGLMENVNGEIHVHCVTTDITAQKKTLEELRRKSFEIEVLTNNVEAAIINCDLSRDYVVNYANEGFFRLIGYTRKDFKSECQNSLRKVIYSDDSESLYKILEEQLNNTGISENVYRIIKQDSTVIWVSERGSKVINSNGKSEFHGVITNITQEEKNRQLLIRKNDELMLSKMRYEIVMKNSKDIIFDYIIVTKEIICTQENVQNFIIQHPLDGGIEHVINSGFIHPNSIDEIRDAFKKIDEGAPCISISITGIIDEAKEILFEVSLTNVFDDEGKPIRAIGVIRNINEKRMLQSEKKYRKAMTSDKLYANELNITQDTIVSTNADWVKSLGISKFNRVSQMVDYMCSNLVHTEYEGIFREFFDKDKITSTFREGITQMAVEYRTKDVDNRYTWVESSMSIIRDDITNDIRARLYIKNINGQKEKEIKSFEERRFYESMVSNDVIVYEVNITQNLIDNSDNYTQMIETFLEEVIHPDDINVVRKLISRENVLHEYEGGQNKIIFEYRKLCKNGNYIWMCCDSHLFKDPKTNEIKGFCYIKDINDKKLKELDLIYKAEHDALTGFYNKYTVGKLIDKYLESDEGKAGKHAFFIFDVDHFKLINDNFGHVFGDVTLSRITQKMRYLFRDIDILGRIGGDEFVVLMKNIPSSKSALSKANEMCSLLRETYTKNEKEYSVSISIGIDITNSNITKYSELYKNSDAALYKAKEQGRNQFFMYNNSMKSKTCDLEKIQELDLIESKSFDNNISEYVFRILYESTNKPIAINTVLGLIGQQYNISRAYVFEKSSDGMYMKNTFEWCNRNINSHIDRYQSIPYKLFENYSENFNNGIFYLNDLRNSLTNFKKILKLKNIKSLLQFSMIRNNIFSGFIGYNQCDLKRNLSKKEITDFRNVANILNVFINEMRLASSCKANQIENISQASGLQTSQKS